MRLRSKSTWNKNEIVQFLSAETVPMRLSFVNNKGEPAICSLWFNYFEGALWSASHQTAYVVKQLKNNPNVAFEISTNDYPYKGVRGKATAELIKADGELVLTELIERYLANSNTQLADWLLSRAADEYAIKLSPTVINSWDFSHRMQN